MAPPHDLQTFFIFIFILLKTDTYGVLLLLLRCGTALALYISVFRGVSPDREAGRQEKETKMEAMKIRVYAKNLETKAKRELNVWVTNDSKLAMSMHVNDLQEGEILECEDAKDPNEFLLTL